MNRVVAVALNTFKETIRDRVLLVVVLFALTMMVATVWLASISLGQQDRLMVDFGLLSVTAFGVLVAVFIAAGLLHKEIEKRTVFMLFSKPVGRGEFIWGKFAGLCSTMALVVGGMGLFLFLLNWAVAGSVNGWLIVATALIYLQVLVIMAVTILFSTFVSPILASVLGICVLVAGQLSDNVLSLTRLGHNIALRVLSWGIFAIVPNVSAVDVKAAAVGEAAPSWGEVAAWGGYLAAYTVMALVLAGSLFRRREF